MHRTEWKDYLLGEKDITDLSIENQRWMRWKIRDQVKQAVDLIITAIENMDNISDEPEKEFDLIFKKHMEKTIRLLQLVSSQRVWRRRHYPITIYDKDHNI